MNREAWLKERQTGVGSSDAANICGFGFRRPADVFLEKVEPPSPLEPETGVLARGIALEPIVAALYARRMGVEVAKPVEIRRHPDRPWQLASIDYLRGDERPVECKTCVGFGDQWGEPGTADVPAAYYAQVQHQMGVIGADWCDLPAVDVIAWELRVYRVPFDPAYYDWLTAVEDRFFAEHVLTGRCPGPEWDEFVGLEVAKLPVQGKVIDLGATAARLADQRKELAVIRDRADEAVKRITDELRALMGDAESATAGGWKFKRVTVAGGPVSYTREPYEKFDIRPLKVRPT